MNAAVVLAAALALAASASHAQERVYRCGASYSQEPCAGGIAVAVDDARSESQRAQALRVAQLDARLGAALARERLQAEQRAARQGPILLADPRRTAGARALRGPEKRGKPERITLYRAPADR
ncbi:MAG: hypothetical protein IT503_15930 [Burkholderiaceae bacterium]|nr:hypothetical protein [Ideonella sp.]MCC7287664.1 hypothetical protein [Burkholderiaceae bacterium]